MKSHIVHRTELEARIGDTSGWQQINLMNDAVAAELDAGLALNILEPTEATPTHFHTGCEHYIFIVSGQGKLILDDGPHDIGTGYMIAIEPEERHAVKNVGSQTLEFLEFLVPGTGTTTMVE